MQCQLTVMALTVSGSVVFPRTSVSGDHDRLDRFVLVRNARGKIPTGKDAAMSFGLQISIGPAE
jgi:hypothetical protein